jgi:hypothetical protein
MLCSQLHCQKSLNVILFSYEIYSDRASIPPTLTSRANSRSQDLEFTSGRPQIGAADKNVFGLQVGVSSMKNVCPARLT